MEENITIEFVRNWIEKHHLTRKSYESVLTDTLTNNGHYYIDNPYLRDWIRKNTEMFRNILPYELNENQQVVLEWLKKNAEWGTPTGLIYELTKRNSMAAEYIITAHDQLNKLEQFQVLAAYAECGMKEVAK